MLNILVVTIIILNRFNLIYSYLDLYLNPNETKSLLGYSGSFYFVYNGELRQNSISHRLALPFEKNNLKLTWKISGLPQLLVNYNLSILNNNNSNISVNPYGLVPSKTTDFDINFDCKSAKDDFIDGSLEVSLKPNETQILSQLQYISSIMPTLKFEIKYRKNCKLNPTNELNSNSSNSNQNISSNSGVKSRPLSSASSSSFTIAYIIIGVLLLFTLMILFTATFMFIKSKIQLRKLNKDNSKKLNSASQLGAKYEFLQVKVVNNGPNTTTGFIKNKNQSSIKSKKMQGYQQSFRQNEDTKQRDYNDNNKEEDDECQNIYEIVHDQSAVLPQVNEETVSSQPSIKPRRTKPKLLLNITTNTIQSLANTTWTNSKMNNVDLCTKYDTEQIQIGNVIMEGTFSKINEAVLKLYESDEPVKVLIKTVNDYASQEQADIMLKESCVFRDLSHKNLNPIMGVCIDNIRQPITVFDYCEFGNLKMYLSLIRKQTKSVDQSKIDQSLITTQELLFFVLQMLKAVNYLHSKHIVHKDIATRNCWLDSNFSLKLSDYALSRDMFPDDYFCLADNENKPVAWMSLETLTNNIYNSKSDIWSCGVFIWECFSLSAQPYENIDPFELVDYLMENESNRLKLPVNSPSELYEVYSKCWLQQSSQRPTLKELFHAMHKFYTSLNNYV